MRTLQHVPQSTQDLTPCEWSLRRRLRRAGRRNPAFRNGRHTRRRQFVQAEVKDLAPKVARAPQELRSLPDTPARARALRWWGDLRALPGPEEWLEVDRKGEPYIRKAALRLAWRWRQLAVRLVVEIRKALGRGFRAIAAGTSPTDGARHGATAVSGSSPSRTSVGSSKVEETRSAPTNSCSSPREPLMRGEEAAAAARFEIAKPKHDESSPAVEARRYWAEHPPLTPRALLGLYHQVAPMLGEGLTGLAGVRALRRLRDNSDLNFWRRCFLRISRSAYLLGLVEPDDDLGPEFERDGLTFEWLMARTFIPGVPTDPDEFLVTVCEALEAGEFDTDPQELVALARDADMLEDLAPLWEALDEMERRTADPCALVA